MNHARISSLALQTTALVAISLCFSNARTSVLAQSSPTAGGTDTVNGVTPNAAPAVENPGSEAASSAPVAKKKKIVFKPGQPLTINTVSETIRVTNDAKLARDQVASFPDSPEAHFVLAVALTRTSQVEQALKEIRVARKLANTKGGAAYFDQMINEYEAMLESFPEDNQIRYHLAWAYYMKAYILARYSKVVAKENPALLPVVNGANKANLPATEPSSTPTPKPTPEPDTKPTAKDWHGEWVSQSGLLKADEVKDQTATASGAAAGTNAGRDEAAGSEKPNVFSNPQAALKNVGPITAMDYATLNAAPEVIPQIKGYYRRALTKLDEVMERDPKDLWTRLYRAHLQAEYTGNIDPAIQVWTVCRDENPSNPAPYFFLGEGYLKKGDLKECLTNVSKAIALRGIVGN